MEKIYQTILPNKADTFESEWNQCLETLKLVETDSLKLFKVVVFVNVENDNQYHSLCDKVDRSVKQIFGMQIPAYTILAEAPETPYKISIEAGLVNTLVSQVFYRCLNEKCYTVIENSACKEVWGAGMGSNHQKSSIELCSVAAFEQMKQILEAEQLNFNHIVRQWNYIARIVDFDFVGENRFQHYQIFNEIRNHYYCQFRSIKGYPAATGIGTQAGGVSIDFCAVSQADENFAVSIHNPEQSNPYAYGQEVLIGSLLLGKKQKQAPQFERGKLVLGGSTTLYVSGTASIIGQETIGVSDIELQTITTINNIIKLASPENLLFHYPALTQIPSRVCIIRTYVKHPEHFNIVKQICQQKLGVAPSIYVLADVCRDDLLVEIEAEFGV